MKSWKGIEDFSLRYEVDRLQWSHDGEVVEGPITGEYGGGALPRFNGATTVKSWKGPKARGAVFSNFIASMEPRR